MARAATALLLSLLAAAALAQEGASLVMGAPVKGRTRKDAPAAVRLLSAGGRRR